MCFERPNYFCGHMLTDRDLMLQQRYVREKNKLYHRALDGHGIVCGLRITCNHECPGEILIEEGYAIDTCGNDLVVCKTARFDVIQRLREKGLLVEEPKQDPCEPKKPKPKCDVTQCFHVTICYKETEADFTTPFVAGCSPTLTECEPTRIREEVWFDVVQELPDELDWIDKLERRIRTCFKLLTHSQFAKKLQEPPTKDLLSKLASGQTMEDRREKCWTLFCELRSLFLLYLRKHPDKYNCTLEEEILHIPFPEDSPNSRTSCHDAICELLKLAWQHVITCVMGEFVPQCDEPSSASCLVLGTVEIRNGQVVQVCNSPRTYIQQIERMTEILVTSLFSQLACEQRGGEERPACTQNSDAQTSCEKQPHATVCCTDVPFDCRCFVGHILDDPSKLLNNVLAVLRRFRQDRSNFRDLFDFTKTCKTTDSDFALGLAERKELPAALRQARVIDIKLSESVPENIINTLKSPMNRLVDQGQPIYALSHASKDRNEYLSAFQPQGMEAVMQAQIDSLKAELADLRAQIPSAGSEGPTKGSKKRGSDTQP